MVSLIRNISIKDILFYLKNRGRIQPVGLGGGVNWLGPKPNLPPNSSFSSDFGHFVMKQRRSEGGATGAMAPLEVQIFFLFRNYYFLLKWAPSEK